MAPYVLLMVGGCIHVLSQLLAEEVSWWTLQYMLRSTGFWIAFIGLVRGIHLGLLWKWSR